MKKSRKVILIIFIMILCLMPIEIKNSNDAGRYEAVLWGRTRYHKVIEQNVGGIADHVKYYDVYKYRIVFIPITIEDKSHIYYAQW